MEVRLPRFHPSLGETPKQKHFRFCEERKEFCVSPKTNESEYTSEKVHTYKVSI